MKQFTALIQQGAVSDIIRWANQINIQNAQFAPFVQEVISAATKGDMARLRQLSRHEK